MPDDQATDDQRDPDAPASAATKADEGAEAGKKKKFWRPLLTIVVTAIALTLVVKAFVVQPYKIPSQSMENTLLPGDRVLVNKLVYHFRGIDRGDIIVFSGQGSWGNLDGEPAAPPSSDPVVRILDDALSAIGLYSNQTFYIKRVIGLPGDHVACCTDGRVTVNGVPLDETSYLYPGSAPSIETFSVIVPAGRLWVMGDNRGFSDDSRDHNSEGFPDHGTIPESEVAGRAFLIIWPPSQFGDLPIPATFKQAALHAGAAGAAVLQVSGVALSVGGAAVGAVAAVPVAGSAGVAALLSAPLLFLRRRRQRQRPRHDDRRLAGP
jgi:signal peptidase I